MSDFLSKRQGYSFTPEQLENKEDLFKRLSKAHQRAYPEYFDESKENQYGKPVAAKPEVEDFEDYGEEGVNASQKPPRSEQEQKFIQNMDKMLSLKQLQGDDLIENLRYGKVLGEKYGTFHSNEDLFDKAKESQFKAMQEAEKYNFASEQDKENFIYKKMKSHLQESFVPSEYIEDLKKEPQVMQPKGTSIIIED